METIVNTADGADSLLINQIYTIAAGGDFWESGGELSTAGSSTGIQMSVSSVTVNIGGKSTTHGSQPVTHSATSGEYRTDVIYADSAGVGVQEGVEMSKLPQGNQFPSIWQPAPDNGSLVPGVPLWCVHITPEDAASADIESWQMQDRRMNAESINSDAVVSLLEDYDVAADGPVATTVENSAGLGGQTADDVLAGATSIADTQTLAAGENGDYRIVTVPTEHQIKIRAASVNTPQGATSADTRCQMVSFNGDGTVNTEYSFVNGYQTFPRRTYPGNHRYGFRPVNRSSGTTYEIGYVVWFTIEPTTTA